MEISDQVKSYPSISGVIVNFNSGGNLIECVSALYKQKISLDSIIIVDNASNDSSAQIAKNRFPAVELIQLKENMGLSKARNIGLRFAKSELVILLDDDVYLQFETLELLIKAYLSEQAAVICPRILLYPQSNIIQCDGAHPHIIGNLMLRNAYTDVASIGNNGCFVGACIGACMLLDLKIIQKVGYFNEQYFFYYEDLEFSLRIRMYGYKIFNETKATVLHDRGEGTEFLSYRGQGNYPRRRAFLTIWNRWLTILLIYKTSTIILLSPFFLIYEIGTIIFMGVRVGMAEWVKAVYSLIKNLGDIIPMRKKIQRGRVLSDHQLFTGDKLYFAPGVVNSNIIQYMINVLSKIINIYWKAIGSIRK